MKKQKAEKNMTKKNHIEQFEAHIGFSLNLLERSETPDGYLKNLSGFLKSIKSFSPSAKILKKIIGELQDEDQKLQDYKREKIVWMLARLEDLKKAKCYEHVNRSISLAESFLKGEICEVTSAPSYLFHLTGYFLSACEAVADFGGDVCFKDWMKIELRHISYRFSQENLPFDGEGNYQGNEKQLVEKIGHGFIKVHFGHSELFKSKFQEYASSLSDNISISEYSTFRKTYLSGEISVDVEYGTIEAIGFPQNGIDIQKEMEDLETWKKATDSKPTTNLRFLLLLSKYSTLKPVNKLPKPTNVFEAEELNNQQMLQYFLSTFSKGNWEGTALSREELDRKVKRMIAFIKEDLIAKASIPSKPHELKEYVREFVFNVLDEALSHLHSAIRNQKKYDDMKPVIFMALNASDDEIIRNSLQAGLATDTLILKQIKAYAKIVKWHPGRGKGEKPKKG